MAVASGLRCMPMILLVLVMVIAIFIFRRAYPTGEKIH
jgi:hypothetical protein